jgi:uncharacterized protein YegL
MSNIFDGIGGIVKKKLVLFFLIDVSGSMAGTKIGAVNTAIEEVIPELRGIGGSDAEIEIAVLTFSTTVQWLYQSTISVNDFQWKRVDAEGVTSIGWAFKELNEKMSRHAFLNATSGAHAPAIFLMSDGQPTDEYAEPLALLQNNRWFKHAIKVAVAIGDDADLSVLEQFTGNKEAVTRVHRPEHLRKMIRFIAITSSKIGSRSRPTGEGGLVQTGQEAMIRALKDLSENDSSLVNAADDWE